ncbi:hypothetical protein Pcinc_017735 [Petrolisthes cinctipes]|uniref:GRIP domain-containing protein n=1 Tax=Petrolisthes cinctipes TaxID=88211 RepID=A0AAE1FTK2_PETCI|nr:hypothetical protein Pcinc_017735 [Petrolisthes cinctipes]
MEQSSFEPTETGSQVGSEPGPGPGPQLSMEDRLKAAHSTCKALTAKIDQLMQLNQQLQQNIEEHKKEKDATAKTVAMLEFNNEHNKSKVQNMELSRLDLNKKIDALVKEKERLTRQLREGSSSGLYEEITKEKEEVEQRLTQEKDELERKLTRDRNALEDRLIQEKEQREERYQKETAALQEKLDSLVEVRLGYEKQIEQIEANNTEMHSKIGAVQLERDTAWTENRELLAQKSEMGKRLEELTRAKEAVEQQIVAQRGVITTLEEKLNTKEGENQGMTEATNTLQNNILNLQKQVEGLNETCSKLARDLEAESKLRLDTQSQLAQLRQAQRHMEDNQKQQQNHDIGTTSNDDEGERHKQVMEKMQGTGTTTSSDEVERQSRDLVASLAALSEVRLKCENLQAQVVQLEKDKRTLVERLATGSPSDTSGSVVGIEHASEATLTNSQQRNTDYDSAVTLRESLTEKQEELSQAKQMLLDVQERLRVAEVVSGEVEEQRARVQAAEAKLADAEKKYQIRVMEVEAEAERRIADTQQLCHQTISSAFDKQDTETSELVRQQQQFLKEAQTRAKEKASQLESVVTDYETKLKEKDEELCQFVQQYEDQLAALRRQHEVQVKEVEAAWQARAEKMARQREAHKQEEMDGLTQEWNKERRSPEEESSENPQELERLTQVAAAAFRSGTESVELLKKQVASQRRELEEVKLNHTKEIGELKALLELKRRTRSGGGGVRLGVALEEAAEFEYLKNILYQYMLGKETQTLSKVLCAVVKFDGQQQREILDHEEQRHSLVSSWSNGLGLY